MHRYDWQLLFFYCFAKLAMPHEFLMNFAQHSAQASWGRIHLYVKFANMQKQGWQKQFAYKQQQLNELFKIVIKTSALYLFIPWNKKQSCPLFKVDTYSISSKETCINFSEPYISAILPDNNEICDACRPLVNYSI